MSDKQNLHFNRYVFVVLSIHGITKTCHNQPTVIQDIFKWDQLTCQLANGASTRDALH